MHVLYDARLLHRPLSGLERVQRNLLREVARHPDVERVTALVAAGRPVRHPLPEGVEVAEVGGPEEILALLLDEARRPDVYHLTYFPDREPPAALLPPAARAFVLSVHDAILNRHPEYHESEAGHRWYCSFTRQLVRWADRIVCHSRSSSRETVEDLGGDPERIDLAPLAVDPLLEERLADGEARRRAEALGASGRFFVAVGKDYPHKGHATLLEALARLEGDVRLFVAGSRVFDRPVEGREPLDRLVERLGLGGRIRWLEGLDDRDVRALLQCSRGLVFPSTEEGFGLPPLEAMALGVTVVAARAMSIPEVCGDGALYFEPGDAGDLAGALRVLLEDEEEAARLAERGRRRAASFSWRACGEAVVESYRRAIVEAPDRRRRLGGVDPELLRVVAEYPYRDAGELQRWQDRCRHAERYAWSLEDQRRELLGQIEALRARERALAAELANLREEARAIRTRLERAEAELAASAEGRETSRRWRTLFDGLVGRRDEARSRVR